MYQTMKNLCTLFLVLSFTISAVAQKTISKKAPLPKEYNHIIAFHPLHAIANEFVGLGLSYERLLNDQVGIKIPVMMAINNPYVNIGISPRFYPKSKENRDVRYAISPTFNFGFGHSNYIEYVINPVTGFTNRVEKKYQRTQVGFILNNSINITLNEQIYFGVEGGIGINYYDNRREIFNNNNISFAAQFHAGVGYRF